MNWAVFVVAGAILISACSESANFALREMKCTDSDGGSNITLPGIATSVKGTERVILADACVPGNPSLIEEAFCSVAGVARSGISTCPEVCRSVQNSAACVPAHCINGVRDDNETGVDCGNGCLTSCPPACGNAVVESGESCDDGNFFDTDACTTSCQTAVCGDGYVQSGIEECDDGNVIESDECTARCRKSVCGDGIVQKKEECDDGNKMDNDECTNACELTHCGDAVKAGIEECDDGNVIEADSCTTQCRIPTCADNTFNGDEQGIDCGGFCEVCEQSANFVFSITGLYPTGRIFTVPCEGGLRAARSDGSFSCSMERSLSAGRYQISVQPKVVNGITVAWTVEHIDVTASDYVQRVPCGVNHCDISFTLPVDSIYAITTTIKKPADAIPVISCTDSDAVEQNSAATFGIVRRTDSALTNGLTITRLTDTLDECVTVDGKRKVREATCGETSLIDCSGDCVNGACV